MPSAPAGAEPAPRPLRERKRERTRERIISEGLRLFLSVGFDTTTVADIAAAAEVSPATVFRYFGTKEALLFANHELEERALRQAVRRHAHLADARVVMAAAVRDLASGMAPEEDDYAARIRVIRSSPVLLGAALRTRAAWEAAAAQELARARSRETDAVDVVEVVDVVAAGAAVGALHTAVQLWFARSFELELTDCIALTLASLWPDLCGEQRPPT